MTVTTGNGTHANPEPGGLVEINIPSRLDLVAVVRMVVAAATPAAHALDGDRLDDLRWVTSEATTNAIEANMAIEPPGRVVVSCGVDHGGVKLVVSDEGPGMNTAPSVPDITHPERLHIEGGFGIPLIRQLSTAMSLKSAESGTTVEMEIQQ